MKELLDRISGPSAKAFTHSGKFHADDVFSSALLLYINPGIKIERGSRVPEAYEGLVFDIGRGVYDHHQKDGRVRENGIAYAAFGLLWAELGKVILGEEMASRFDREFVQPLDVNDNTGERNELASLIGDFNPPWDEEGDNEEAFFEAVKIAGMILENKFVKYRSNEHADQAMEKLLNHADGKILVMPSFIPWQKKLADTEIEFVIFPSNRGGYCVQPVKRPGTMSYRCDFPSEWLGREGEELKKVTGLTSAGFCHKGGFIFTAGELEDAIKACRISQRKYVRKPVIIYYQEAGAPEENEMAVKALEKKVKRIQGMEQAVVKRMEFPIRPLFAEDEEDYYYDVADMEKEEWKELHRTVFKSIMKEKPEAVIVDGSMVMSYPLIHLLRRKKVPVLTPVKTIAGVSIVRIPSGS